MSIAETTPEARDELARLERRLDTRYAGPGHIVREILPGGYPAYVRILHPFVNMDNGTDTRTWADMAARIGLTLHGETYHGSLAPADVTDGPRQWLTETGRLRPVVQRALASVLTEVPSASEVCFGYILSAQLVGWVDPIVVTAPLDRLENLQRRMENEAETQDGPQYWWPRDHAWIVYTSYDLTSTYVACSDEVAHAIVAHPDIEALYVTPEARIDSASDRS